MLAFNGSTIEVSINIAQKCPLFCDKKMSALSIAKYIDDKFEMQEKAMGGDLEAMVDLGKPAHSKYITSYEFSHDVFLWVLKEKECMYSVSYERPTYIIRAIENKPTRNEGLIFILEKLEYFLQNHPELY